MATLTWRNVDAPSFAGSLDGLRTASTLLNNATRSGMDLLDTFKQTNSDAADRAILNRAMVIQDPAAYRAALADGTLVGGDGGNVSLDTLRGLDNRAGTLLNRAVTQQNYDQTGYTNIRGREGDALMDAAGPDVALARTLAQNNDMPTLNRLIQTSPALRNLRPEQLAGLFTSTDTLAANAQARRAGDAGFTQGQWRFGNEVRNQADDQSALTAWQEIQGKNATLEDVQAAVTASSKGMTPGAQARLQNLARGNGYQVNGPVGGTSSGGGSGSGSAALSVMTGGAALPDNIRTIGDMVDNKASLLKTNPKGTATGMWQITADTWTDFAPRALGSNWRSADIRDPQVQNKVAESIWNSARNSGKAIKGRWDSLTQEEANSMQGMSWEDARDVLSRKESGVAATEILNQTMSRAGNNLGADITRSLLSERAGQNQATGIFPELQALQNDRRTASDVVSQLTGKDGPYAGSDRGELLDIINGIVQRSRSEGGGPRINPAMAAEMLARNVESADGVFVRGWSRIADVVGTPFGRPWSTPDMAGGVRINDRGVRASVDDYLTGATSDQRTAQSSLGATNEMVESAQSRYNAADAQYQAMLSASKGRPGLAGNLEKYKQRRDAAEQALRRVVQSVVNNDSLTPNFNRPVATTTAPR